MVSEHIRLAEPIGSRLLMERAGLNVSSATIRNELAELEAQGYIFQPHTSAGRVPTAKGYEYYITNIIKVKKLTNAEQEQLVYLKKDLFSEENLKALAKFLRDAVNETVIIAFDKNSYYYTGIANLFSKPEFADQNVLHSISSIIDHLDEALFTYYETIDEKKVLIGAASPFGVATAAIIKPFKTKNQKVVVTVLGPMRMDYSHVLSIIDYFSN